MSKRSEGETHFNWLTQSESWNLPIPEREYRFRGIPPANRRWRFDFAWPDYNIAVEIQGGQYTRGGHARIGKAWLEHDKMNSAQVMGWIVLQVTPEYVGSPEFMVQLEMAFSRRKF